MTDALSFIVIGVAQPKGSTRSFVVKGHAVTTSANPKNKGWQQLVAEAASHEMQQTGYLMIDGPVAVEFKFYLPRPKAIKSKTVPHVKKPDLDKLSRSVKDALTKVCWQDDSQVVSLTASKRYARPDEPPRAIIHIAPSGGWAL